MKFMKGKMSKFEEHGTRGVKGGVDTGEGKFGIEPLQGLEGSEKGGDVEDQSLRPPGGG